MSLLMVFLFSSNTFGQPGTAPGVPPTGGMKIDGYLQRQTAAGDWLRNVSLGLTGAGTYLFNDNGTPAVGGIIFHLTDLYNNTLDDIFSGSGPNQLNLNPNSWNWSQQKPQGKDDINNSLLFITQDPVTHHIWVYVTGDRKETNGTSYLDIEFYQSAIFKTGIPPGDTTGGGFVTGGTANGRTIGDLDITSSYVGGGSNATIKILKWTNIGTDASPIYDYVDTTLSPGLFFVASNSTQPLPVPYGAFGLDHYTDSLQFIEVAVDITAAIGGGNFGECGGLPFKSIFIKSKSSASDNATLKDFIEPLQINVCFDHTPPVVTPTSNASTALGCNPSTATINGALDGATASDNCAGALTPTASDGAIVSNGCARSLTRTWSAVDGCGNTGTASRTVTWTEDVTAPTITATGGTLTLGCNPSTATINGALGTASATDACATPTITSTDGAVQSNGCARSQTRTWTATDGCGNTATTSRTATWTFDVTPPTITATGNALGLGCNPSTATIDGALGTATATDACGTPTVTSTDGAVSTTGCGRSQTRTFTAVDGCGNTATTARTATWTVDVTAPTLTATGNALTLGCNPSTATINGALGTATATDACGTPTLTSTDGAVVTNGCGRSQTRTWTAIDGCGNTATIARTATWTADVTAPTLTATGGSLTLGCNPSTAAIDGALGTASATDACGTPTVTSTDGAVQSNGCARSQTRTWTATDGCGNTATTSRTATWTFDVTAPTLTATGDALALGCNPSTAAINGALGTATATDACGTPTLTSTDGAVQSNGCARSQTRSWTAIDGCGNTATTSRTATWTFDVTAPTLTATGGALTLGCNPSTATINGALGTATATDACGTPTLTSTDGAVQSNGCARSQTRSWTAVDGCGNTATTSRTATWTEDVTAPTLTATGGALTLGCNPSTATINGALGTASATDACGTPTVTSTDGAVQSNGCARSQTRSWSAVDGCGNVSTTSRTATWTEDVTAPTLTATGNALTLGCNPSTATINGALGTATATDACGTPTLTSTDGAVQSNGCARSQTRSWTAIDGCGNTATTSRTATWTEDVTAPTLTATGGALALGCNPSTAAINGALGTATATDACGTPTLTSTDGAVQSNGCARSQTRTWTAVDGCGNTATTARTATWTADVTAPTLTATGNALTLGCNPSTATIDGALGTATATDACGTPTVTSTDGAVVTTGCSRSQTRTWTAIDGCGNTATIARTATWTADVTAPTLTATGGALALGCNPSTATINGALGTATATDACGTPTVTSTDGAVQSNGCARSQTRTWTATDGCGNTATTSRTATWTADVTAPTLTATGGALTLGCNPSTATINGALGTATATDACGTPTLTSTDGAVQSNGCARSQTRTWTAIDGCGNTSTIARTATWTADVTPPTITCVANKTIQCNTEIVFNPPTATDACGTPTITVTVSDNVVGNVHTRVWTATDGCGNTATCSQSITVNPCAPNCTYTQGYYGNTNGNSCNGTQTFQNPIDLIVSQLANGGDLIVGRPGFEVIIPNSLAGATKLNSVMPGGHTPTSLNAGNCSILNACFDAYLSKQGRINNVLLSQTITLALNLRMPGSTLGSLLVQNGWLATQKRNGCGAGASVVTCASNSGAIQSFQMNSNVVNYLTNFGDHTATVNNLLALANDVLGHVLVPGTAGANGNTVPSFADITAAIDAINNAFDGCREFIAYFNCAVTCANIGFINPCVPPVDGGGINTTDVTEQQTQLVQKLNVSAYPNPYNDNVRFVIQSPVSGQGSLEVYNLLGQKLQTVYQGFIFAGRGQVVEYKVPVFNRTNLIYILKVGGQQVTGKLLRLE